MQPTLFSLTKKRTCIYSLTCIADEYRYFNKFNRSFSVASSLFFPTLFVRDYMSNAISACHRTYWICQLMQIYSQINLSQNAQIEQGKRLKYKHCKAVSIVGILSTLYRGYLKYLVRLNHRKQIGWQYMH